MASSPQTVNQIANAAVRIKICGLSSVDVARACVDAGVDAVGLMFYAPSPRNIAPELAREIALSLPAFVNAVAVFADPEASDVDAVCRTVPADLLQFHGDESAAFCTQWGRPYIKGVRMRSRDALVRARDDHPDARGFLVDAYAPGEMGGTGHRVNWTELAEDLDGAGLDAHEAGIILAGGLRPDNVADAIAAVTPWAVDVSSGVESAPGEKSVPLVQAFAAAVGRTRSGLA